MAGESDSLTSTLAGGHEYMYENCCDFCEREGLQKEAFGFCVDCQDFLCKECFSDHVKHLHHHDHVLLDQNQMPSRESRRTCEQYVIHVRSKDYRKTPKLTGCVVLPGAKLVVVDNCNIKVNLIDLTNNTVVSQLALPGDLWDITKVSSKQVAVTSFDTETIYFVNVNAKQLTLDHKVKVNGKCWGIDRFNDTLVVSYDSPVKVEILSMKGKVLQTVVPEEEGRQLFARSLHVAVSRDQQSVYISDFNRGTVTRVDLTGQVQAKYQDCELARPRGLTVASTGRVYVCDWASCNILQLTADLTEVRKLLKRSDDVVWPSSVYYCDATDRLYIGMCGEVKVSQRWI